MRRFRFALCCALLAALGGFSPLMAGEFGSGIPSPVRQIGLKGPAALDRAELSGLSWHGDDLILLPQYPERRLGRPRGSGPALYALSREELRAAVRSLAAGGRPVLAPRPVALRGAGWLRTLPGYEGLEAAAVLGNAIYFLVERSPGKSMAGTLLRGHFAADGGIDLEPRPLAELPTPVTLRNMAFESLVALPGEGEGNATLLAVFEANGGNVNPRAVALAYDGDGRFLGERPFPRVEYRLTDATAPDATGRVAMLNTFWPGDIFLLDPGSDQHGAHPGLDGLERMLFFRLEGGRLVPDEAMPLLLTSGFPPRNWEGIVRLDDAGYLVVTDKHPRTLLGFVPAP